MKFNPISNIFIEENMFENVVCEIFISYSLQCVKQMDRTSSHVPDGSWESFEQHGTTYFVL